MAEITDLVVTIARSSEDVVSAQITYTIRQPSSYDALDWREFVAIYAQVGGSRRPAYIYPPGTKDVDPLIATIHNASIRIDEKWPEETKRSYEHVFSTAELSLLLRTGREHPYALAAVDPFAHMHYEYAGVDIDVGDPGEGSVILVPPAP